VREDSAIQGLPIPSGGKHFPSTQWHLIRKAKDGTEGERKAAREQILWLYYAPVYRFFQRVLKVRRDDVTDVTQDYFKRFLEKDFLKGIRHEKSFRGFVKTTCRSHYQNWREKENLRKTASLVDEEGKAIDIPVSDAEIDRIADDEFGREYLQRAIQVTKERLESEGKGMSFRILEMRDLSGEDPAPKHKEIAKRLGIGLIEERNRLHEARVVFRAVLKELASAGAEDPKRELSDLGLDRYF
jgi:DNA-directed RNA polymerase specialized sigma24 family protein